MSKIKKIIMNKQVVLSLLIAIVVLAGVINWLGYKNSAQPVTAPGVEATAAPVDFFAQSKLDRDTQRAKTIELLQQNNQTDEIAKQNKYAQEEGVIEDLIKAKGYANAIAYIDDNSGTFVVQAQGLTAGDVAQIRDIILSNSDLNTTQIKVSEHSSE